jgi:hypothetical protein
VAIIKATKAQSTGAPVNLLCEKGVVNVQPANVLVSSLFELTTGKNKLTSTLYNGWLVHLPNSCSVNKILFQLQGTLLLSISE